MMTVITNATSSSDVSNHFGDLRWNRIARDVIVAPPARSRIVHAAVCRMLNNLDGAVIPERNSKRTTNDDAENSSRALNCTQSKRPSFRAKSASRGGCFPKSESYLRQCREYLDQNSEGDTRLHVAVVQQLPLVVLSMVRAVPHPSYLDIKNDDAQTPLHVAVITRQADVVYWLLEAGADASSRDRRGNTALHLACQLGDMSCVRALTKAINPFTNTCHGRDTKTLTKPCQMEGVKALTKPREGQDTKAVNKHSPMRDNNVPIKSCLVEEVSCVKALTNHSVGQNTKVFTNSCHEGITIPSQKSDIKVPTALSKIGYVSCVKAVVKRDVRCSEGVEFVDNLDSVNLEERHSESRRASFSPRELAVLNFEGETCAHVAVNHGHVDLLRWLIECGADPDAREAKSGNTVLHVAVERNIASVSRYLLDECDVDLGVKNYAGLTAGDVSRGDGHVSDRRDEGGKVVARRRGGETTRGGSPTGWRSAPVCGGEDM